MKELSIEQKAKRYDEAIKEASVAYKDEDRHLKATLERIFPELKESEDEKIRKLLIRLFTSNANEKFDDVSTENIIAWLERQGNIDKASYEIAEKENNVNEETNAPTAYGKYVDECLNEAVKHFFSEGEDKYTVADLFYAGVRCGQSWFKKQGEPNPYSGVSFKYNGHTWGMCARDGGVEILIDSNLKAFVSLDKSFIYPIRPQPILVPQSELESAKEEKVDNQNCANPTDKVKPKFHEGDWVVDNRDYVWKIERILNQSYVLKGIEGGGSLPTIEWVDKNFHLWTIQDAKDGDVLVFDDIIMIFKNIKTVCTANTYILYCDGIVVDDWCDFGDNAQPATKEQCQFLFQKMKEEGWEFDFEKKELKKIEQKPIVKDKSVINILNKENQQVQQEDLIMKPSLNTKQEWSEEDEEIISDAEAWLDTLCDYLKDTSSAYIPNVRDIISKLESLKGRVQPQKQWKPSEEQMDALETAVSSLQSTALETLYQNLKRL